MGVAPLAGAWIETSNCLITSPTIPVAPLAGAWIETSRDGKDVVRGIGRAPRGRVD